MTMVRLVTRRMLFGFLLVAVFAAGMVVGALVLRSAPPGADGSTPATDGTEAEAKTAAVWTCSMHPSVRRSGPGQCPICFMDLIPVETDGGREEDSAAPVLNLSPRAAALADLVTTPVLRRFPLAEVRMVGTITVDETRIRHITARVPGRIDRLYINYTGIAVREGDHMADLYSPELIAAHNELRLAVKSEQAPGRSVLGGLRGSIRERLRLWGVRPEQINRMEQTDEIPDHLTIYAPTSGIVTEKPATEGMYVEVGTRLYTIADLSKLWLELEAYESDLTWLRYGQTVKFEVEAYPGEAFEGRVSFIDPLLDPATRTVPVRVVTDNAEGRLKPGMFARAVVHARLASGGRPLIDPALEGKWICPMHPEIIADSKTDCDICGMDLVPARTLGFVTEGNLGTTPPLVVPSTAPLLTGKRAIAYVALPDRPGAYAGREIVLGPRAGDEYIVESGLEEGDEVVVHGNFKIDSALQILGRPSMMSPSGPGEGNAAPAGGAHVGAMPEMTHGAEDREEPVGVVFTDVPPEVAEQMGRVLEAYFPIQEALAADDFEAGRAAAGNLARVLEATESPLPAGEAATVWDAGSSEALDAARRLAEDAGGLGEARDRFRTISRGMIELARRFPLDPGKPVILFFCPMAFNDQGAEWLQSHEELRNPYFGAQMLRCGVARARLHLGGEPIDEW